MPSSFPVEVWFSDFHHFFFVFARFFGLVMGMPFLSQVEISTRFRGIACFALTFAFDPLVPDDYFGTNATATWALCRFLGEFLIGFFLGLIARFAIAAVELAGHFISYSSGLSSATIFNPSQANQGSVISLFLTLAATTSFLVLDGHHYLFKNVMTTYTILTPNWFSLESPLLNDFSKGIINLTDLMFKAGLQLSIPFLIVNSILQFALGVLGKLVPQIQVFFLGISLQVLLCWFVLLVSLGAMLFFYEKLNTSTYAIMGFAHG